jgi:hypothetical protein
MLGTKKFIRLITFDLYERNIMFDLYKPLNQIKEKRKLFHSEADFQFALAWEIQLCYPDIDVRMEYRPKEAPNMHIDIFIHTENGSIPIELKYKTLKTDIVVEGESFFLKDHGAQDIGKYDCLTDLSRIEWLSHNLPDFIKGYTLWLTNDPSYWTRLKRSNTIYEAFSIHEGAIKQGEMAWAAHAGEGTTKNRTNPIQFYNSYVITGDTYSIIGNKRNETFKYALLSTIIK